MHWSVTGHDWNLVLDDSALPSFRWRCSRCLSVVSATRAPRRNRRVHPQALPRDHPGLTCEEVLAYGVLSS